MLAKVVLDNTLPVDTKPIIAYIWMLGCLDLLEDLVLDLSKLLKGGVLYLKGYGKGGRRMIRTQPRGGIKIT